MAGKTLLLLPQLLLLLHQEGILRLLLLLVLLVQMQAQQQQQQQEKDCWGTYWGLVRHLLRLVLAGSALRRHALHLVACQQLRLVPVRPWAPAARQQRSLGSRQPARQQRQWAQACWGTSWVQARHLLVSTLLTPNRQASEPVLLVLVTVL
jgi:hypothetical protein